MIGFAERYEAMNKADHEQFANVARKLLSETNIVREAGKTDAAAYRFIRIHEDMFRDYLEALNYTIYHDRDFEVYQLRNSTEDGEPGLKSGRFRFTKLEMLIYVCVLQAWWEHFDSFSVKTSVEVPLEEVQTILKGYIHGETTKTNAFTALKTLKHFNLLRYKEGEDGKYILTVFPTIAMCMVEDELDAYVKGVKETMNKKMGAPDSENEMTSSEEDGTDVNELEDDDEQ